MKRNQRPRAQRTRKEEFKPPPLPALKFKAQNIQKMMGIFGNFIEKKNPDGKAIYRDGQYWDPEKWAKLSPFAVRSKFCERLEKKGFKKLGGGYYSNVYAKEGSDKVIKVGSPSGDHWDAWIDYCLWAGKQGYGGKFAPRVYSYKKFSNFYVAIMERLDYTVSDSSVEENSEAPIAQFLFSSATECNNPTALLLCDILVPELGKFSLELKEEFKSANRFDLHGGNIMYRKDGSICVTDPVCHESQVTQTRLKGRDFLPTATLH